MHMGGQIDCVRADIRADNFFAVRLRTGAYSEKNFKNVERRRPND